MKLIILLSLGLSCFGSIRNMSLITVVWPDNVQFLRITLAWLCASCPCRCCASCVTGLAFALIYPLSVPQEFHWCWTAAGAARCALGSEASHALRCFRVTAREHCSVTTVPASLVPLGSVSVSASSNKQATRPMSVWV